MLSTGVEDDPEETNFAEKVGADGVDEAGIKVVDVGRATTTRGDEGMRGAGAESGDDVPVRSANAVCDTMAVAGMFDRIDAARESKPEFLNSTDCCLKVGDNSINAICSLDSSKPSISKPSSPKFASACSASIPISDENELAIERLR